MLLSSSSNFIVAALLGAAIASTPPGFEPSSSQNLTVAFGSTLAIDGKDIIKAETANAPTVGTASRLFGTYAILMVDPDIPPSPNSTNQLLHWLQTGLTSATTPSTVAGVQVYELINAANTSAFASYRPPNPPARLPLSHRYVQLLLNVTNTGGNSSGAALSTLQAYAQTRTNFSAATVVRAAGLTVLAGNWFNVTNTSSIISSSTGTAGATSTTGSTASPTGTTAPGFTGGAAASVGGGGALVAGLGAFAAAFAML